MAEPAKPANELFAKPASSMPRWAWPTSSMAIGAALVGALTAFAYAAFPQLKAWFGLGLYSRLERPNALAHPVRAQLVDVIQANPGVNQTQLVRIVGRGRGAVGHHLRRLVQLGLIREAKSHGVHSYFVGEHRSTVEALAAIRSEGAANILRAILAHRGESGSQIAARTGYQPPTVNYHVRRMAQVGLIQRHRRAREVILDPTSLAATLLEDLTATARRRPGRPRQG